MPTTKTIQTFKFEELSDDAKETARQWWRSHAHEDNYWSEATIEEAVREAEHMGIEISERRVRTVGGKTYGEPLIFWSGFASQGDGACFEGTWCAENVRLEKVADGWGEDPATTEIKRIAAVFADVAAKYPESYFKVKHSGHYYHEYCTEFDCDPGSMYVRNPILDAYRRPEDPADEADSLANDRWADDFPEKELIEAARDYMNWIYRQLEKEWDYRNSDEAVDEDIIANEYAFTEDGDRKVVL